jgi:hypothetical protein
MSRNTSNQSHGADGSWFLEAVGAKPPTPKPSETVAELSRENTEADDDENTELSLEAPDASRDTTSRQVESAAETTVSTMSFDGDPGTSTSSFDPIPAAPPPPDLEDLSALRTGDTGEIDAVDESDAFVEEADPELSPALRSRRRFRWPVIALFAAAIGLLVAAVFYLPRAVEQDALAIRQSYYDASADVRGYIPDSQAALDAITNPSSSQQDVSGAVPKISELDSHAFALETVTAEPLPDVLPLVPSAPIDDLEPLQDRGAILGAASSAIARGLGNAYIYRTSIPLLMQTGPLPATATTQEVNEISVRLAASLAADAGIVADLPDDPNFVVVADAARLSLERYRLWQDEYLTALTGENSDAAGLLISEIETTRADLASINETALLAYRSEADAQLITLAGELEGYMTAVTQT